MGRVAVAVVFTIIVAFAGCQTPGDDTMDPAAVEPSQSKVLPSRGTGSIDGLILDPSQLPLANVTVFLEESGAKNEELANTTTSEIGEFRFENVEAGTYRIRAVREGFGEAAVLTTVVTNEASAIRLTLQDIPSAIPYLEVLPHTGIFACAFAFFVVPEECDPILELAGGDPSTKIANFTIQSGHQAIVMETSWGTQDTMDVWSSYVENADSWKYFQEVRGTPILRQELTPGLDFRGTYASLQNPDFYGAVPASHDGFTLNTETIFIGQYQEEADQYLNPVCVHTWGNCTGVGAVFDFRFDQYISTFYHAAPADLAVYSAIPKDP